MAVKKRSLAAKRLLNNQNKNKAHLLSGALFFCLHKKNRTHGNPCVRYVRELISDYLIC